MIQLSQIAILDAALVLVVTFLLALRGRLSHSHPAALYLVFHVFIFSARSWSLNSGSPPFLGLSEPSAARALLMADAFLFMLFLAWMVPTPPRWRESVNEPSALRPRAVRLVSLIAFPVGLFMLTTRTITGGGSSGYAITSYYQIMAITWPGLVLVAFIYIYGLRWYLMVPMAAYLAFMAVQGSDRFRVVIPAILLVQVYLDRRGRLLPDMRTIVVLGVLFLSFLPMDQLGTAFRAGNLSVATVWDGWSDAFTGIREGETSDQNIFDMYALTVQESDALASPQYGRHFADLLALPVPRPWWPDKPATNEHMIAISSNYPLAEIGAVFTLPGELYSDFRWVGIVVGGFLVGRCLLWAYQRAYARGYGSLAHFTYLLLAASLIQIYRDGLAAIPLFIVVQNAPLIVIAVWCWIVRSGGANNTVSRGGVETARPK